MESLQFKTQETAQNAAIQKVLINDQKTPQNPKKNPSKHNLIQHQALAWCVKMQNLIPSDSEFTELHNYHDWVNIKKHISAAAVRVAGAGCNFNNSTVLNSFEEKGNRNISS